MYYLFRPVNTHVALSDWVNPYLPTRAMQKISEFVRRGVTSKLQMIIIGTGSIAGAMVRK